MQTFHLYTLRFVLVLMVCILLLILSVIDSDSIFSDILFCSLQQGLVFKHKLLIFILKAIIFVLESLDFFDCFSQIFSGLFDLLLREFYYFLMISRFLQQLSLNLLYLQSIYKNLLLHLFLQLLILILNFFEIILLYIYLSS